MEIVTPGIAARINEQGCDIQDLYASSNNVTPTRTPRRKKSMFSLAGSIFKSHASNDEQDHPRSQQDSQPVKGSWNPFTSLRGSKEGKKQSATLATTRGKSSSPEKDGNHDTLIYDELGKRKTMRRKSLQDLLGTVGTKFSRGRRQVVDEDITPACEDRGEEAECPIIDSPYAVQDSSLLPPMERHEFLASLDGFRIRMPTPMPGISDLKLVIENSITDVSVMALAQTETMPIPLRVTINEGEGTGAPQMDCVAGASKSLNDLKSIVSQVSLSPEKRHLGKPCDLLQDVSPQIQKCETLSDREPSIEGKASAESEDANTLTLFVPVCPSSEISTEKEEFPSSSHHERSRTTADVSSKEIAQHIISTTAKMSENYHLSPTSPNRRLVDTSESDVDTASHYSWDANEPEVWDVVSQGQNVTMKGMPTLPGPPWTEATSPCSTCSIPFAVGSTSRMPSISSALGSNAMKGVGDISVNGIRVRHPQVGYCESHTTQHASMSDAMSDLCHKFYDYSPYCLFDRATMTLFPQPYGELLDNMRPPEWDEGLEIICLESQPCLATLHGSSAGPEHVPAAEHQLPPSSSGSQCTSLASIPELLVSGGGSLASKDDLGKSEEMDSVSETPVDSVTARAYSRNSYSSTESVDASSIIDPASLDPANSVWYEIDEITSRSIRPLKTWADLGKEFLDKHAPGSHLSQEQRAEIAVQEALRRRRAAVSSSEDMQRFASDYEGVKWNDEKCLQHPTKSCDRGSSDDLTSEGLVEIPESERIRAESKEISQILDPTTDDRSIRKVGLAARLASCFEEAMAKDRGYGLNPGQGYTNPTCPAIMCKSSNHKIEQHETEATCQVSDTTTVGSRGGAPNDELPITGDVDITTLPVRDEKMVAEMTGTALKPAEYPKSDDRGEASASASTHPIPGLSISTCAISETGNEEDAGSMVDHDVQLVMPQEPKVSGLAVARTADTSTGRPVIEATPTGPLCGPHRIIIEKLIAPSFPASLSSPPSRCRTSTYTPIVPSPLSGHKRIVTPGKRALTRLYHPRTFEAKVPASPASDADSEVDYEQELKELGLAEGDDMEHGDRRHMNFRLYGHQIHYTGLKDTMSG